MKKEKKSTPEKMKQSKITAFCLKSSENSAAGVNNKKRRNEEVCELYLSPSKKARSNCKSPDLLLVPSENSCSPSGNQLLLGNGKQNKNEFENFLFDDDFENDPFLSPKKEKSPRKTILGENCTLLHGIENIQDEFEINFETPVKCRVVKGEFVTKKAFEQVLIVREETSGKRGQCKLRDVWTSYSFSADDVVSIQAAKSEEGWVVDNKNGYIILYPDVVIASTTLVGSMFCMRQGLFSNFFKTFDSEGNSRMLIGRLIHELFQESLKTGARSDDDFAKIVADSMSSGTNLRDFYFSDTNISKIEAEVKSFLPRIRHFLDTYVYKNNSPSGKNFNGSIEDVLDIEELIRSPNLGFQGRVDVTVKVKSKNLVGVAPLELKTGRASFSKEHRSQLVLYIFLMNELGRKVESGLLLYLKEDIMEEVMPQRDEIRNLFLLRNHFVDFYRRMRFYDLPEPIRNIKCCSKCSYLRICTTYIKGGESDKLPESHPLREYEIPDIKPSHVDYFVRWNKMLWLEYEGDMSSKNDTEISGLILQPNIEKLKGDFKCVFQKSVAKTFRPGTFVHVMNGKGNRICTGHVIEGTDSSISVTTDKKPDDFTDTYKIDIFKSKFLNMYLSNLGCLLEEQFESLRDIIIDRKLPSFDKNFDKKEFQEKCLNKLLDLNKDQQKAILKSLLCRDYMLIKGPPGTGKTQTIVSLVKILLALNKSVLIASHTHSSIDNILLRLSEVEYLRLGSLKSIHKEIHRNSYAELIKNCKNISDIENIFDRKLIASTCLGIEMDFIQSKKFDVCIIDESSQVLQPEILKPLFCSKKFILVGDEDQLPPIVQSTEAKKLGMDESIFEWLKSGEATVSLKLQYRMNSVINSMANAIAYNGMIECANEEVAKATLKITNAEVYNELHEWIRDILSTDLEKSIMFVDTSEYFQLKTSEPSEGRRCSLLEANILVKLINCLKDLGMRDENVGVITPFWDQIVLVKKKLAMGNHNIELNTVDQYQGRDKEVIILSCARENQTEREVTDLELLSDQRRLTVAVTRAKHKLIILGDQKTVARYKPFEKLIKNLRESQFFHLSDGHKNFFWENFRH